MKTLSQEDVRRIVNGGERFLVLDLTNETALGPAVHIPFDDAFAANALEHAGQKSLPIIIRGTAREVHTLEQAAATLREAGCLEVWTYFDPWPPADLFQVRATRRHNVVSDPDAPARASHARPVLHR
jgi:hypothetical protein